MTSFVKILTDEAVSGWKMEIHVCIIVCYSWWQTFYQCCEIQEPHHW